MGRGGKGAVGAFRAGGKIRRGRQDSVAWGLPPCSSFTTSGHVGAVDKVSLRSALPTKKDALCGKRTLAPDLPQFQRLPVFRAGTAFQVALSVCRKVADGHFSCAAFVALAQAFFPQRTERTVPLIRLILPKQAAGAAGQPP